MVSVLGMVSYRFPRKASWMLLLNAEISVEKLGYGFANGTLISRGSHANDIIRIAQPQAWNTLLSASRNTTSPRALAHEQGTGRMRQRGSVWERTLWRSEA